MNNQPNGPEIIYETLREKQLENAEENPRELEECLREKYLEDRMLDELGYVDYDEIKLKHARHQKPMIDIITNIDKVSPTMSEELPDIYATYHPVDRYQQLKNILNQMKNKDTKSIELHFPGQNYTGPGTHIISRIADGVMPNNKTDAATLMHDIDYMLATNKKESILADISAIKRSDKLTPEGLATTIGLTSRSLLTPQLFYGGNPLYGDVLKQYVKLDPQYQQKFKEYGLSNELANW